MKLHQLLEATKPLKDNVNAASKLRRIAKAANEMLQASHERAYINFSQADNKQDREGMYKADIYLAVHTGEELDISALHDDPEIAKQLRQKIGKLKNQQARTYENRKKVWQFVVDEIKKLNPDQVAMTQEFNVKKKTWIRPDQLKIDWLDFENIGYPNRAIRITCKFTKEQYEAKPEFTWDIKAEREKIRKKLLELPYIKGKYEFMYHGHLMLSEAEVDRFVSERKEWWDGHYHAALRRKEKEITELEAKGEMNKANHERIHLKDYKELRYKQFYSQARYIQEEGKAMKALMKRAIEELQPLTPAVLKFELGEERPVEGRFRTMEIGVFKIIQSKKK